MTENSDNRGEYRWGRAWATAAVLAAGVLLLFFPTLRPAGIVILAGYVLIVGMALRWSIWYHAIVDRQE